LFLSGVLEDMTTKLMRRLAARSAEKEPTAEAIAAEEHKFFHRIKLQRAQVSKWLEKLGRDSEWLNKMLSIEAAYGTHCNRALVPEARQRELVTARSYMTRFEVELIELESQDAAREASFCVLQDGMSMEEVATEGRYPYRRASFLLEELPADTQQKYLSVSPGDMLKPTPHGDGFELCRIMKKVEPELDDPMVKSRLDQRLLDRYFSDLTTKYTDRRLDTPISIE